LLDYKKVSSPESPILLATGVNARYLLPLRVLLSSLARHLPAGQRAVLYLLHTGLTPADIAPLQQFLEVRPLRPTPAQLAAAVQSSRFPVEASFPLLLPDLLPPAVERVLFLDADLLVRADISPLWHTPLPTQTLAAAVDQAVLTCGSPRGVKDCHARCISPGAPYFNGGVLLIHLPRWRERNVSRLAREYLAETGPATDFLHQEALNAVLAADWLPLDQRWNALPGAALPDARIVHFAGRLKPWRARTAGPHGIAYHDELARLGLSEQGSPRDAAIGLYDRFLRRFTYPFERFLWNRRLL
jgi:lipopolysaccharide biosynthesis glycosyltransferase